MGGGFSFCVRAVGYGREEEKEEEGGTCRPPTLAAFGFLLRSWSLSGIRIASSLFGSGLFPFVILGDAFPALPTRPIAPT